MCSVYSCHFSITCCSCSRVAGEHLLHSFASHQSCLTLVFWGVHMNMQQMLHQPADDLCKTLFWVLQGWWCLLMLQAVLAAWLFCREVQQRFMRAYAAAMLKTAMASCCNLATANEVTSVHNNCTAAMSSSACARNRVR